jgi:hypothetical protein
MTEQEGPTLHLTDVDERVFIALDAYHAGFPLRNNLPAYRWREEPTPEELGLADDREVREQCFRDGWALLIERFHLHAQVEALRTPWVSRPPVSTSSQRTG